MYKIIILLLSLFLTVNSVHAESISKTIKKLGINSSAVSVSVKDINNGHLQYALNDKSPKLPASTMKILTASAAYDVLGPDYKYKTTLYKSINNDLYIKLSGDPLLKSDDLGTLIDIAKTKQIEPKNFYIDDSVFDKTEWGEGWQWDDDLNPLMPKFSAYNIDNNLVRVEIMPTYNKRPASITVKPFYPLSFINSVITDSKQPTKIKVERNNDIAANMYNVVGTVSKAFVKTIPVANPKMNFVLRLEEVIRDRKFEYYNSIQYATLPDVGIYVVDSIEHGLDNILRMILKQSNNYVAETLFKTAGAQYAQSVGSQENSIKMLNAYLNKLGIDAAHIRVVDGSGVSKNNLMTADFMTDFLVKIAQSDNFELFKDMLPVPGEGTLKNRMLYFKDNLNAKTGTLSDTSAIAGYIKTRRGKVYAFDIMICDAKTSSADKKNIEEQILRTIYTNY
ncbi:MAG: D-alanyl-D-alanine carboxypeptidase/D-alanyl-D-alanine-endopeptidase [Cyanobacteria bacterium SIG26]|nr:D-alanyl-D-alanine carboxypeptidase/D-alanyl-D-alanine-endopeptidase [Cyanobacteria bacterium SIG26]